MNRSKIKFEEMVDIENCRTAILKASKNKGGRKTSELKKLSLGKLALNDNSVIYILNNLDEYSLKLQKFLVDLLNGNSALTQGNISIINDDGTSKKKRELCKPRFFPEQCVHWAVMLIVNPVLEKCFDTYSCASIKGRGTHYATRAIKRYTKDTKGTKYCGQFDIKGFYKNINKEILISLFKRKFKDKRIVDILSKIVYSYNGDGLPLGYYTSAPFANFYLTGFDEFIRAKLNFKYYVRYMDDFVIYDSNKRKLHNAQILIDEWLKSNLKLDLKPNWQIYKMPYKKNKERVVKERRRPTDFIGFKFYRYKTTIRKSILKRMKRLYRKLWEFGYDLLKSYRFVSYNGYIKHTDSYNITTRFVSGKINRTKLKEIISYESRRKNLCGQCATRIFGRIALV